MKASTQKKWLPIHKLFEQRVVQQPEQIAIIDGEGAHTTYNSLNKQANKLGNYLRKKGVKAETIVGICLNKGSDLIVAMLACLKSDATFFLVDANTSKERTTYLLNDSSASMVITKSNLIPSFKATAKEYINLDQESCQIDLENDSDLISSVTPNNACYLIYTSGTTGHPKATINTHSGLTNLISEMTRTIPLDHNDRFLQFCSMSFDGIVCEVLLSLLSGATLVLSNVESYLDALKNYKITAVLMSPSALAQIDPQEAKGLNVIISGGEACSLNLVKKWQHISRFFNAYGPAEAAIISTLELCNSQNQPSLGYPIKGVDVYILDNDLNKVAIGQVGEIYIAGHGLARGYLNRPALTAEKFLPNPFSVQTGTRMYATGDYGEYLPNGKIKYHGRKDNQVKINGIRIELEEIEACLTELESVKNAAVIIDSRKGIKSLVAFVIMQKEAENFQIADIKDALAKMLPAFMVPQEFIILEDMPLNMNGKIDRALLLTRLSNHDNKIIKPRKVQWNNEVLATLSQIWKELLKVETQSPASNFFRLGGDSLRAIRLIAQIKEQFALSLTLAEIFQHPTLEQLSDYVQAKMNQTGSHTPKFISTKLKNEKVPPTFVQERLWFLNQLEPSSTAYNMPSIIEFKGQLDIKKLVQAITRIVQRHEIFRTYFEYENGQLFQKISNDSKPNIVITNLSDISLQGECIRTYLRHRRRPFDLSKRNLHQFEIIKLGSSSTVLHFDIHHVLFDGWSLGVFLNELKLLYEHSDGIELELPSNKYQYRDYANWQKHNISKQAFDQKLDFWEQTLKGAPPLTELPMDFQRSEQTVIGGDKYDFELSKELCSLLTKVSNEFASTPFAVLLTVFNTLISRLNNETDIVIGTANANREIPEVKEMMGCLVDLLILRNKIQQDLSFAENLSKVQNNLFEAYTNQDVPFEKIVEKVSPERSRSYHPIFQLLINMINIPINLNTLGEADVKFHSFDDSDSKFDLTLYFFSSDENITASIVYRPDLFSALQIKEIAAQFLTLLDQCLKYPNKALDKHTLHTPTSALVLPNPHKLLKQSLSTQAIFEDFEKNACEFPGRVALHEDGITYSYKQLSEESSALANLLTDKGIKKGDIVAIYAERKATFISAILAVLKAEAIFLILDSSYPTERLTSYLKKAQPHGFISLKREDSVPREIKEYSHNLQTNITYEQWGSIEKIELSRSKCTITGSDLAYILFTSGTTREPKGIVGAHEPINNFINWYKKTHQVTFQDRFSLLSGLSHDPVIRDIFIPLSLGASIYIPNKDNVYDPFKLKEWMHQSRITVSHITPPMWNLVCEGDKNLQLDSLRYVFFAGAPVGSKEVNQVFAESPGVQVINCYGTTETPQIMAFNNYSRPLEANVSIMIGREIDGAQIIVANKDDKVAAIGEKGEIWVRTPYLTLGYLNNQQETAKKFIVNPFTADHEDLIYKTGDIGRYNTDGKTQYLGRKDRQIKIRGYRIELEEIEDALSLHPDVLDTVITVSSSTESEAVLKAYVVTKALTSFDYADYQNFLKRKLPSYMIPAMWFQIDKVPLTPNGKIDFRALDSLVITNQSVENESLQNYNQMEGKILSIWKSVLNRDVINLHDNFFNLGGHSLLIAKVLSKIYQLSGCQVPLRFFFDNPTVSSLALYVTQNQTSEDDLLDSITAKEKEEIIKILEEAACSA